MKAVTDEQLIQWVADGDSSCLATLFERHHRALYSFVLQITRHRAQSEDLVQDVFLKILKKAKSFRGDSSFKACGFKPVVQASSPGVETDDATFRHLDRIANGSDIFSEIRRLAHRANP